MLGKHILIADDDPDIVILLTHALNKEGFIVHSAGSGSETLRKIMEPGLSLILLDIVMPDVDGLEICRRIRDEIAIPIILLSAKDRNMDKILGLELGADDYITKPFNVDEVIARVKSHLRREKRTNGNRPSMLLQNDSLTINKETHEVYQNGQAVKLSTKEFQILVYLAENQNRVLSREQIYDAIWGIDEFGDLNTVTVHLKNIRLKLDPDHKFIKTVWGAGYKFVWSA